MPAIGASKFESVPRRILSTSAHPQLGPLRAQVLRTAGYDVTFPESPQQTLETLEDEAFDVLIIGHSISAPSAKQYVELFRTRNPRGKVLVAYETELVAVRADAAVRAVDGPDVLIATIEQLCGSIPGQE